MITSSKLHLIYESLSLSVMSSSPVQPGSIVQPSRSHSSAKLSDDVASLTSFNPFSEEDDNDKSSYTLVTSIFSRMKNTLSAPLASTAPAVPSTAATNVPAPQNLTDQRRLSHPGQSQVSAPTSKTPGSERPNPLHPAFALAAPPLVSLTPAQSEVLAYNAEHERSPSRGAFYSPVWDSSEGALFGTSIPGFPIPDDARSIRTSASLHRNASVSKVIRRLRGEGEPLFLIHVGLLMAPRAITTLLDGR
jgi:1-phosphatidylinositol-3-phosphate 5-kinase